MSNKNNLKMFFMVGFIIFVTTVSFSFSASASSRVAVPTKALLEATMNLTAPTGPTYSVEGILECSSISREIPPYALSQDCSVITNDGSIQLSTLKVLSEADIQELVEAIMEIVPPTGPAYKVVLLFSLTHLNTGFGPEATNATVTLDQ